MKAPTEDVFQAIADPTRRSILQSLGKKENSIRGIAEAFPQSRNAIVKHLAVLKAAALVEAFPQGRETIHRLVPGPLEVVKTWLGYFDAFWDDKLTRLKLVAETEEESPAVLARKKRQLSGSPVRRRRQRPRSGPGPVTR